MGLPGHVRGWERADGLREAILTTTSGEQSHYVEQEEHDPMDGYQPNTVYLLIDRQTEEIYHDGAVALRRNFQRYGKFITYESYRELSGDWKEREATVAKMHLPLDSGQMIPMEPA